MFFANYITNLPFFSYITIDFLNFLKKSTLKPVNKGHTRERQNMAFLMKKGQPRERQYNVFLKNKGHTWDRQNMVFLDKWSLFLEVSFDYLINKGLLKCVFFCVFCVYRVVFIQRWSFTQVLL